MFDVMPAHRIPWGVTTWGAAAVSS